MSETTINIVCGKYDSSIAFNPKGIPRKLIRLGSTNPNRIKHANFYPISTNGKRVLTERGYLEARDFFYALPKDQRRNLITLTRREQDFLLELRNEYSASIFAFEDMYPFYRDIRFRSNLQKNYRHLLSLLDEVGRLSFSGVSAARSLSTQHQYKIERSLRFKTNLDRYFSFASLNPYQEVFKLKEERPGRVILAFDFNSMFVECMKGDFMSPKNIRYIDNRIKKLSVDKLPPGLFRVLLKSPKTGFFRQFHPFKYVRLGQSHYFDLESNHQVEILAFRDEIMYFRKFFKATEVLEGFYSDKATQHPLINQALEIFSEKQDTSLPQHLRDLSKFRLVTMHSATNPRLTHRYRFRTIQDVLSFLSSEYFLSFPKDVLTAEIVTLINGMSAFSIYRSKRDFIVTAPEIDSSRSLFSLSTQIIANSRIKVLKTIEEFLQHKSVEICYVNVDSIHVSIEGSQLDSFLKRFSGQINQKLGGMKIEATANKGYWFDVGRYWLCDSNEKIVKFRNIGFRTRSSKNAFERSSKIWKTYFSKHLTFAVPIYRSIFNSFSYSKKAVVTKCRDVWNFERYSIEEVVDLDVANKAYCNEILESKNIKTDLFDHLTEKLQ